MNSSLIYFLFSLCCFIYTLSYRISKDNTAFSTWLLINNDTKLFLIFANLISSIIYIIFCIFQDNIIGKTNSSIFEGVKKNIQLLLIELIVYHVGIPNKITIDFYMFAIYVGLRSMGFVLLGRVNSIYNLPAPPKLKVHIGLLTAELACLFINFRFIAYHLSKWTVSNRIALYHLQIYLCAFIEIIQCLRIHHIFLLDHRQLGNSYESFKKKYFCDICADIIKIQIFILYIVNINSINSLPCLLFSLTNLIISICRVYMNSKAISTWKGLIKILNKEMVDATAEDLATDSTCLICRDSMSVGNAKKLPCGHVYHLECLEKWVVQQSVCPICHYDLTNFVDGKPDVETPDQLAHRVLKEVRHIVKNQIIEGNIPGQNEIVHFFEDLDIQVHHIKKENDDYVIEFEDFKSDSDEENTGGRYRSYHTLEQLPPSKFGIENENEYVAKDTDMEEHDTVEEEQQVATEFDFSELVAQTETEIETKNNQKDMDDTDMDGTDMDDTDMDDLNDKSITEIQFMLHRATIELADRIIHLQLDEANINELLETHKYCVERHEYIDELLLKLIEKKKKKIPEN